MKGTLKTVNGVWTIFFEYDHYGEKKVGFIELLPQDAEKLDYDGGGIFEEEEIRFTVAFFNDRYFGKLRPFNNFEKIEKRRDF